jgi:hypothetical protein
MLRPTTLFEYYVDGNRNNVFSFRYSNIVTLHVD